MDISNPKLAHAARRLQQERIIWLTTVRPDGQPQTSPVWFWWDGKTFLIYSEPGKQKLASMVAHPQVSLNLDGDGQGGDIVAIEGRAHLAPDAPPANRVSEYVEKYQAGFKRIGMDADKFASTYSVAIRVTPERTRAW